MRSPCWWGSLALCTVFQRPYLPARPRPPWLPDSYRVGCFQHWSCSCFFQQWWWVTGRWRQGAEGRRVAGFTSALHSSFSLFGVLTTKGEKRVISITGFFLVWFVIWTRICFMHGLWYFKWLVKFIMLIWYLSMGWMIILIYLSIYVVCLWNKMCGCAFVSMLYWCNLVHIHYLPHYLVSWLHSFF
jgi:hypothetical protein